MDEPTTFITYVNGKVVPIQNHELAKYSKNAVVRVPQLPDDLELQVALDELSTSGSTDTLKAILAKQAGVNPNEYSIVSTPWKAEGTDANQLSFLGKLDTVDESGQAGVMYSPPKDIDVDIIADVKTRKPFQYQSIPETAQKIRLLKLKQTQFAGHYDRLGMHTFDMDNLPNYSCLSYVWGNPERFIPVNIDGRFAMVTQNLYHALRMSFSRYPDVYLWADGLCINQEDLDERSRQVLLMGKIYTNAEKTLAFPGHHRYEKSVEHDQTETIAYIMRSTESPKLETIESDDCEDVPSDDVESEGDTEPDKISIQYSSIEAARPALSLMNYITRIWNLNTEKDIRIWEKHKLPDTKGPGSEIWSQLLDFWREDWTSRSWVQQEVILSKKLTIFYGLDSVVSLDATIEFFTAAHKEVPPKQLRHGIIADMYNKVRSTTPITSFAVLKKSRPPEASQSTESDKEVQGTPKTPSLLELLATCRQNHVTDDRDKIYAVLALTYDPVAKLIKPNYHEQNTVSKTYINLAHLMAGNNQLLQLLEHAGANELDIPSWIPDWSKQYRSQLKNHLYSTASRGQYSATLLGHNNHLQIKAAKLSTIKKLSPAWNFYDHGIHDTQAFIAPIHPMKSRTGETIDFPPFRDEDVRAFLWQMAENFITDRETYSFDIYTEDIEIAAARTLCADVDWNGKRIYESEATQKSFVEAFRAFRTFYGQGPDEEGSHLVPDNGINYHISGVFHWILDCSDAEAEELMHKLWPFAMAYQDASRGRRFAVLANGMLALVPWDVEKQDIIIVFDGGRVPFVVRKTGETVTNCFKLIGDAYVHGVMDGELFDQPEDTAPDHNEVKSPLIHVEKLPALDWREIEIQ